LEATAEYEDLTTEAVQSLSLALESVDHIHGSHGLATSVLSVGDSIADDLLKEDLEDAAGLLVDEARNALHAATTSEATDSGLRDALNVVTKHLAMTFGATFAQTLATFSAA